MRGPLWTIGDRTVRENADGTWLVQDREWEHTALSFSEAVLACATTFKPEGNTNENQD